ncbi:MAG: glycoside hydrolase domain-containing protein [Thermoguttaceae bacterium]
MKTRTHIPIAMTLLFLAGVLQTVTAAEREILNMQSPWRVYWRNGPRVAGADGKYRVPHDSFEGTRNADPRADWAAAEFDDQTWAYHGIEGGGPGFGGMPLVCSRGRFAVSDPARVSALSLTLAYRGGVIVYVNGKEIGRSHMPSGQMAAASLADDYPEEALLKPDGKMMPELQPGSNIPADLMDRYKMRTRNFTVAIPSSALRKGVNVLAIENHRSACYKDAGYWSRPWPTSGIQEIHLTASGPDGVAPNIEAKGVHVWNVAPMTMVGAEVSKPDPLVELKPVKMQAPLGGEGSGQIVVSSDSPLSGLSAVFSDLTGPEGAKISAGAVQVRYAHSGGAYVQRTNPFDALADKPMADTKLQPVWVTATVPANTKPGVYTGTLSLSGATTAKVPVELTVYGWTLPDRQKWKSKPSFYQSPETLAKYYKVPLWSDEHFTLIEQSLILQGRLGEKLVHVLAVGAENGSAANLGCETMMLYKREGNKVTPDFTAVERYLRLYKKHVGDPTGLILHVWNLQVDHQNPKGDRSAVVTFRVGDKFEKGRLPPYEDPSIDGLWHSVVAGVKRIMKDLNWPESALVFGMTEDANTKKETTAFFAKHFPEIKWLLTTHGTMPAPPLKAWGNIGPCGFCGGDANGKGWRGTWLKDFYAFSMQRAGLDTSASLNMFRMAPLGALTARCSGTGANGIDRWEDKATGCYILWWGQILRGNPSSVTAPGPNGAIPTVRYEMMRAGICEAEAAIYVEDNAANPNLPAPLAARAKASYPQLVKLIQILCSRGSANWEAEIDNLYQLAAEMQTVLGTTP